MKTQILNLDGELIELEDLENDNFVQVRLRHADAEMTCDVSLVDLHAAVVGFVQKRSQRLADENLMP